MGRAHYRAACIACIREDGHHTIPDRFEAWGPEGWGSTIDKPRVHDGEDSLWTIGEFLAHSSSKVGCCMQLALVVPKGANGSHGRSGRLTGNRDGVNENGVSSELAPLHRRKCC